MDENEYRLELSQYINKILSSSASKKLIVAGPGTGKTSFFKRAIEYYGGEKNNYLVLTFINNLEDELQRDLGEKAKIYTFHGYCHYLLRKYQDLKTGLQNNFIYYPPLIKLVKSDWEIIYKNEPPEYVKLMRKCTFNKSIQFFLDRGDYYNTVGYDDSVFRVYKSFTERKTVKDFYKLIIVDEYQDFNALETSVLSHIANYSPILVVGDDDQALYCQLRDSDPIFIRNLFEAKNYEKFELPFCLRCPNAVISAFNKIIISARSVNLLGKRIKKRFDFFPPVKEKDSRAYPKIKLIISSIQKKSPIVNYFGRYIVQEINKIPKNEIKESHEKNFPTVLIIGPSYYLKSLLPVFEEKKLKYEFKDKKSEININSSDGLKLLMFDKKSNLGLRILLEADKPDFYHQAIASSITSKKNLHEFIPVKYYENILEQLDKFKSEEEKIDKKPDINEGESIIKLVTYEGAKGLSAQHVFILGMQNGNLPRDPSSITDIEVCKFLVALTRTRKQCQILCTNNFAGKSIDTSVFIQWLPKDQVEFIKINKDYWKN